MKLPPLIGILPGNWGEDSVPDETAVCNACGWEGVEDEVLEFTTSRTAGDRCPQCRQWEVNYFTPASE